MDIITEELIRQYFENYFERLYVYAWTIVKDGAEAKDIAQSSFIKLWEKKSEIQSTESIRAYLYTTVYHLAMNAVRNKKTHEQHHQNLKEKILLDTQYSSEHKEARERILYAIDQLPPRCKEVFLKNRFEGKKYAEIAGELSISEKTVEAQMGKALKYLRAQLRDLALAGILLLLFATPKLYSNRQHEQFISQRSSD